VPGGHLVLVRLHVLDELLQIVGRRGQLGDDELRVRADHADGGEVLQHVVLHGLDRLDDHVRADVADADHVAVGA
jgi:hypothetical protein